MKDLYKLGQVLEGKSQSSSSGISTDSRGCIQMFTNKPCNVFFIFLSGMLFINIAIRADHSPSGPPQFFSMSLHMVHLLQMSCHIIRSSSTRLRLTGVISGLNLYPR